MILIDTREDTSGPKSKRGSKEIFNFIKRLGVPVEETLLPYGDYAFEGRGPKGGMLIGAERKRLHDMLHCIDDSRYGGHQKIGMHQMYLKQYLILEGIWAPGTNRYEGALIESRDGSGWFPCNYRSRDVLYSKLRRYLFSVSLAGVEVIYTRDPYHTACDVVEAYHYFQKPWEGHTSFLEVQKPHIPYLMGKPPLVRLWADALEGVGVKHGQAAQQLFKTPRKLANSQEEDWMTIPGIGAGKAISIIRQIQGGKK